MYMCIMHKDRKRRETGVGAQCGSVLRRNKGKAFAGNYEFVDTPRQGC